MNIIENKLTEKNIVEKKNNGNALGGSDTKASNTEPNVMLFS